MSAPSASYPLRPNVLEIDLDAAGANIRAVRQMVGPERKIFAVVKADGYGQGAAEMSAVFVSNGADALAVADLSEGIRLRKYGIAVSILVYPNSLPKSAPETIAHGLTPALVDLDSARAYANAATGQFDVFVKIDVGYDGLGVPVQEAVKFVLAMLELPHLNLAGICAHGHAKGDNVAYVEWQVSRLTGVIDELKSLGVNVPIRMLAASPFVIKFPETYLNAVEPGRILYGISYAGEEPPVPLSQTLRRLVTCVIAIEELMPDDHFAELAPFPVKSPMRVGVIPMGAADGLNWLHADRMLVRGRSVGIVAKPLLEHTRIDLTEVPDVRVGDEVVIIGRQGEAEISVAEVAALHGLKRNQVATTVGSRVTRMYRSHGRLRTKQTA
jgi:alanine racemase